MSKRKRFLVTVSPEMYELVKRLGKESDIVTSRLLGTMLEEAKPTFETMLETVRLTKKKQANAYDTMNRLLSGL